MTRNDFNLKIIKTKEKNETKFYTLFEYPLIFWCRKPFVVFVVKNLDLILKIILCQFQKTWKFVLLNMFVFDLLFFSISCIGN